jgi:hypothetical protein
MTFTLFHHHIAHNAVAKKEQSGCADKFSENRVNLTR